MKKSNNLNKVNYYCIFYPKENVFSVPFVAMNDAYAKQRIYNSMITGATPELIYKKDARLVQSATWDSVNNIFNNEPRLVCDVFKIEGVDVFVKTLEKSDNLLEVSQKGSI